MNSLMQENIAGLIERLHEAGNQHDLQSMVAHFAPDYLSEPPNHPERAFRGRAQVEKNWSAMFAEVPDIRLEVLDMAVQGNQAWTEVDWSGTFKDQTPFHWRGVMLFTVEGDEVRAARLYMEPVEESGPGIDAAVKQITRR
jgi:ketosteroid isomerase-like protein